MFLWKLEGFADEGKVIMFDKEVCIVVLNRTPQTIYALYIRSNTYGYASDFRKITLDHAYYTEKAKNQAVYGFIHIGMYPVFDWYRLKCSHLSLHSCGIWELFWGCMSFFFESQHFHPSFSQILFNR